MPWRKPLGKYLSAGVFDGLCSLSRAEAARLQEIRVRAGQPVCWVFADGMKADGSPIAPKELDALVSALCGYSRYAFEAQMAQGYIALPGGHRAGVCGRVVYEEGKIVRMSGICSVCIRIARRIDGASASFRRHLFVGGRPARVLLLGPPGCGKTTSLRDAAMYLAAQCGLQVAAADEREELFLKGEAQIDVLSCARKAEALMMLMRSMAPQVIVTDEIGRMEDAYALLDAASCGIGVLASAHASGITDVLRRPVLKMLFEQRAFDRYILLGAKSVCMNVWDANGNEIMEEQYGELGSGGRGDDRHQYNRLFPCGGGETAAQVDSGDAQMPVSAERRRSV